MRNSLICLICSFCWAGIACAEEVELCGNFSQGELIVGQGIDVRNLQLNGKSYPVNFASGEFLFALGRDEAEKIKLELEKEDDSKDIYQISVVQTKWDVQSIKGVAPRKVTPTKEDNAEILREQKDVRQALAQTDNNRLDWQRGFILPLEGAISGHFGNQRIFNNVPKNPHTGIDIAAPEGTPVKASGKGRVLLSGGNYFFSGNMVVIDHGYGLQTIYAHLKEVNVKVGDEIKQGDVIGLVGKTGRATGPHLHWGASLNNVRFRPHSLLDIKDKPCKKYSKDYKGE